MDREPEAAWLRLYIIRLRAAFRYALEPRVEAILRETIGEMEERLEQLEAELVERSRPARQKLQRSNQEADCRDESRSGASVGDSR